MPLTSTKCSINHSLTVNEITGSQTPSEPQDVTIIHRGVDAFDDGLLSYVTYWAPVAGGRCVEIMYEYIQADIV